MSPFSFDADTLSLPKGAYAKTTRRWLSFGGKRILALTAGPFRPYLFPLFSPAGYPLTSESPADHPHHNSCWAGSDHVHLIVPTAPGKHEEYTYNFYVNETFQGRAPGRQIETACSGTTIDASRFRITQEIEWRGPSEWAAPEGRAILHENRQIDVTPGALVHRIDILSRITALDAAVQLGPTRHAFFNARVAETLTADPVIRSDRGPISGDRLLVDDARWVDFTGPVGGGARAGIALISHPVAQHETTWFVADWGVMTTGAFRSAAVRLPAGATLQTGCSLLLHDGDIPDATLSSLAMAIPERSFLQPKGSLP